MFSVIYADFNLLEEMCVACSDYSVNKLRTKVHNKTDKHFIHN